SLAVYNKGKAAIDSIITEKLAVAGTSSINVYKPVEPIRYITASLKYSYNYSTTSLHAYGLSVAKALEPLGNKEGNEIATMLAALQNKDQIKVQSLLDSAKRNKQIIASLLKIVVPQKAATVHLGLINALEENRVLIADMALILDSPYQALESANLYRVKKLTLAKAIEKMNDFFQENNVRFTKEENRSLNIN
ncbi:MAG: hypothetical protein NTY66_01820, partial [Candidatus Vogelbacteria bacterium]|nr:hypothetical protein [Candidatus Vogelbacteria bacterium]